MSVDPTHTSALNGLSHEFITHRDLLETHRRIAELAVADIEPADSASIVSVIDGVHHFGAATDAVTDALDELQVLSHDGPAIDSCRLGEILRITSTVDDGPWSEFRELCAESGFNSMISFPLISDGVVLGALNMFSADYHAFGAFEIRSGRTFATDAAKVMANAQSYWQARNLQPSG